jgi:hypothetical protein
VRLNSVSSSVYNLRHYPVGSMVASTFFTSGYLLTWPALIALALLAANGLPRSTSSCWSSVAASSPDLPAWK